METLDVTNLPKSKVEYLKQLIEQWREEGQEKTKEARFKGNDLDKDIVFTPHKSKVIGSLRRCEMYEDV